MRWATDNRSVSGDKSGFYMGHYAFSSLCDIISSPSFSPVEHISDLASENSSAADSVQQIPNEH